MTGADPVGHGCFEGPRSGGGVLLGEGGGWRKDGAGLINISGVRDADVYVGAAHGMVRDVLDHGPVDGAVGHNDPAIVERVDDGGEQLDPLDLAENACHVDDVADLVGSKDQQHPAGGEVRQRSLKRQAHRQTGGADDCSEAGRLHSEITQTRQRR